MLHGDSLWPYYVAAFLLATGAIMAIGAIPMAILSVKAGADSLWAERRFKWVLILYIGGSVLMMIGSILAGVAGILPPR